MPIPSTCFIAITGRSLLTDSEIRGNQIRNQIRMNFLKSPIDFNALWG